MDDIEFITLYTDIHIEPGRVRLGVCPSGIKPSKYIVHYDPNKPNSLHQAIKACAKYVIDNIQKEHQ